MFLALGSTTLLAQIDLHIRIIGFVQFQPIGLRAEFDLYMRGGGGSSCGGGGGGWEWGGMPSVCVLILYDICSKTKTKCLWSSWPWLSYNIPALLFTRGGGGDTLEIPGHKISLLLPPFEQAAVQAHQMATETARSTDGSIVWSIQQVAAQASVFLLFKKVPVAWTMVLKYPIYICKK